MGEVQVGDQLIGADGRPTLVMAATEVMHGRPTYEVHFSDGSVIVADEEHQWLTVDRAARRVGRPGTVRTTVEIQQTLRTRTSEARLNHSVLTSEPVTLPERDLPLPPYVLGAWLGDGASASAQITTTDNDVVMRLEAAGLVVRRQPGASLRYGLQFPKENVSERYCVVCGASFVPRTSEVRSCGQSCGGRAKAVSAPVAAPTCADCGKPRSGFRRCNDCHRSHGTVQAVLRTMGVLGDKHIPGSYLRASEAQRRELLAGLLDTDGTVHSTGAVQFSVTCERLALDVYELVVSLGYCCSIMRKRAQGRTEASSIAYTVNFTTDDDVFHMERKRLLHKERRQRQFQRRGSRFITEVRQIESRPVRCVEVSAEDHLYLAGRSMIPTHNSTLGLDIARAASIHHGMTSVMFSLEMGRNEITMRLLSAEARIPLQNMRKGTMREEDWTRLARTMGDISEAPLFIDDSPNMSLMEIRAKCRRLSQKHDLKLVIIDYLQLMTSGKRVESRQQEVSEFSRALKLLAKELRVPVIALSQLNRGPEQRTDKKPQMSDLRESGCLTADTRVLRADSGAEVTLGELYEAGSRDIPVWSLDDSLRYVRRHLTHVFPTGRKQVFTVKLASGKQVRATSNHPFLTYEGWRPIGDLAPGARVAVPRHVCAPEDVTVWDDKQIVMLAHMIGDGSFVRRQPIRYASIDEANLLAVTEAASFFGISAVRDEYAAARVTTLRLPAPYRLTHGRRNPIAAWLDGLGLFGLRSHEKFVPQEVFSLPKRQISTFLRHIWATDGSVTVNKTGRGGRVYYASTSRALVDDLTRLLLRFGISSRIRTTRKAGYRDGYTLDISGCDDQRRFLNEIGVHGARGLLAEQLLDVVRDMSANTNVDTVPREVWTQVKSVMAEQKMTHREFASAMGTQFSGSGLWKHAPSRARLGRVAELLGDSDLEMLAVNDVLWDVVLSVEPDGEEEVYDATVVGTHNFVANGIAVHNSIEQDADMVILLHREDAYEKESPRAGEADFIVAKHRNGPTDTITVAFQGHYSRFVDMAT